MESEIIKTIQLLLPGFDSRKNWVVNPIGKDEVIFRIGVDFFLSTILILLLLTIECTVIINNTALWYYQQYSTPLSRADTVDQMKTYYMMNIFSSSFNGILEHSKTVSY